METKYYYIRDNRNTPVITVCLMKNETGELSRGIAVCSVKDNPCKKTGKRIALARARRANGSNKCDDIVYHMHSILHRNMIYGLIHHGAGLQTFMPKLSAFESKLLKR